MPRSLLRRTVAAFVLTLLLAAVAASAAPRPSSPILLAFRFEVQDALTFAWKSVARLWTKEGGSMDPSGKPPTGQTTDAGGSLDPDGVRVNGEAGSSLDPSGSGGR